MNDKVVEEMVDVDRAVQVGRVVDKQELIEDIRPPPGGVRIGFILPRELLVTGGENEAPLPPVVVIERDIHGLDPA